MACRTLAPFNEPSTIYWWAGNNQEGCHFDIATQNVILQKLAAALQESGLAASGVGLAASDETSIDSALLSLQGYTPPTLAAIEQINTHAVRSMHLRPKPPAGRHAGHMSAATAPKRQEPVVACMHACMRKGIFVTVAMTGFASAMRILMFKKVVICAAQYLGSLRAELRAGVKAAGKRLWMSEFGCGSSPPNGMKAGLELSTVILKVPASFLEPAG
jgi:hypothetical protein